MLRSALLGIAIGCAGMLTAQPLYCVVDLSKGANAERYAVTYLNEAPAHGWSDEYKTTKLVLRRITSYYIGVFEVTQKQYALVTGTTPSHFAGHDKRPVEGVSYNMIRGSKKGSRYPQTNEVDGNSFLGKLRTRTGLPFDLPTESQWERACRAGSTADYSYGSRDDDVCVWSLENADKQTHDVGTRQPNAWGLYDMRGNVAEWCLDWRRPNESRAQRGGSWYDFYYYCTFSYRGDAAPSGCYNGYGLRLCCAVPSTTNH